MSDRLDRRVSGCRTVRNSTFSRVGVRIAAGVLMTMCALGAASALASMVSGTIKSSSNQPIDNAEVALFVSATQQQNTSTFTDADGHYSVVISNGAYDLRVTPPDASGFLPQTVSGIAVKGDTTVDVILVPAEPVTYNATLVDPNGAPIEGQRVVLFQGSLQVSADTDAQGAIALSVAPGDYQLHMFADATPSNGVTGYRIWAPGGRRHAC